MTKTRYIAIAFIACCLQGCSTCSTRSGEARQRAEKAAQELISTNHADTIALEAKILDAKSIQGEYAILGDSAAVKAFDEAFRNYVKQHDDSLARAMF
jgi:menaquinone-dependent protoporphyrinogen IX oxidase